MGTVAASFDMTAEGSRAAGLDSAHRLKLFERERVVVTVRLAVLSEDVGQFDAGPGHGSGFELSPKALLAGQHWQRIQRRGA